MSLFAASLRACQELSVLTVEVKLSLLPWIHAKAGVEWYLR